ncbi:virE N-terminal domain protein [Phocaeicola vulgatus str. 3775 SL(B) 10 (iv)]|nr:virE N-terminal domain protein [Phocaeicola vulgatus str. 3775 SR(B) 19]KDS32241.1 virE N-terminal domain protein [Phocaeicola vulgatus str. 3775 SL(B) 10 (iv)]
MTLKEFVKLLRGERWKVQVEEYQRLKASGRETEAKKLKRKLAALVIAGRCDGSHAETNLKQWSGDAMLDVDKCNGRVSEFLQVLKDTPWVKAAWRSVSYDGLKLVVRVEAESVDEYRMAYALVAWHVAQLLAFPCDMSCKNPTRPCFASYDPEAFFRPDTEVFPWRRFVTEHPDRVGEILAELKVKTPAGASGPPVAASGMLHTFFNEFLEQNPFVDGKKNEFLLKLGRIARYKGVGEEELARLKTLAVERLAGMGCAAGDIPPRIDSGYRYADMNKGPETPASRAHKAQGSPMRYSEPNEGEEEAELEKLEADKLRREVPCLPDELFDRLPDFLKRGLTHVRNKRERDILLLSMITNISGCLPGVRMNYGGMVYSADLYLVALAGSGRGKGVMQLAAILPAAIQEYYDELNRKDEREYRQKLLKWNLEERLAAQEKRVPDLDQCPEMPVERILKVAPNISKSQLILALEAGGAVGLVMNASELDMISSAMHQEYGKHDDVMRAASQHEEVSSYFKTDHRLVVVSDPHLALCASGTPAQLHKFISSLENGMYSRVAFYVGQAHWEYKSANPGKARLDMRAYFKGMGEELLRMFIFLSGSPTEVVFTEEQWKEHTERFRTYLREVVAEDDDSPGAIVLRHGLMMSRIAMVLTALRKCEPQWNTSEWECSDEDFHTAMQIVDVLLEHSLLLSTSMDDTAGRIRPVKAFFKLRPVLKKMPREFTYSELMAAANEAGLPTASVKRYLLRLVYYQIVEKEDGKYRKTGKSWLRKPPK